MPFDDCVNCSGSLIVSVLKIYHNSRPLGKRFLCTISVLLDMGDDNPYS